MWQERGIDPITMELVNNQLQATVDDMVFTLGQTCASQLIKDAQDFSVGICDERGDLLAISNTAPGELGVIPACLKIVIGNYDGRIDPGDVFIVNDPYHGGSHLNDLHIMQPVFVGGRVIAYVTTKAHHTDVGGRVAGSMAFDNSEIFQEGIRIPPLKLYERGEPNEALMKLLRLNVRYPDELMVDVHAQVTALKVGEAAIGELARVYGEEKLRAYFQGLLDYAEALARRQIAEWPDGTAEFEDYCDDDGVSGKPIVVHVRVTISGEDVLVDYSGTSPQVPAGINMPPYEVASGVYQVLRWSLKGNLPNNSGLFRSVQVTVPEGTILNPRSPGPCSERGLVRYRVADALCGALAKLVPDGVLAGCEGGTYLMRLGGKNSAGQPFLCVDLVMGTWGARAERDGIDGLSNPVANHTNTPVELIESRYPVRVESHALVPDSGGPGKFRGGLAIERSWRYLGPDEGFMRSRGDRHRFPPYGLEGGGHGAPSALFLQRAGEGEVEIPLKGIVALRRGDVVRLRIAGGGGWGDPTERDRDRVARDLREGKVSATAARENYQFAER